MAIAEELRDRTFRYALRIISFCRSLPDCWDTREMGRQLLRAATGVAANYRSACRGRSHREFVARLGVAVDECDESVLWLTLILQSGMGAPAEATDLLAEGNETLAILSKSHRTARENRRRLDRQITNSPTRQFTKSI